jgi:hypothetical protein
MKTSVPCPLSDIMGNFLLEWRLFEFSVTSNFKVSTMKFIGFVTLHSNQNANRRRILRSVLILYGERYITEIDAADDEHFFFFKN